MRDRNVNFNKSEIYDFHFDQLRTVQESRIKTVLFCPDLVTLLKVMFEIAEGNGAYNYFTYKKKFG